MSAQPLNIHKALKRSPRWRLPSWTNMGAVTLASLALLAVAFWTAWQAETEAPPEQLRAAVRTLLAVLLLSTVSTIFYRWYVYRLRMQNQQADLERQRLGPYDLEGKLGEGGMGVVYRARHALLRRPTAIKILPPEKSSQTAIERFEREVNYTSQLKHPNTISIYDYGRTDSGLFYYAMEYLDGLNLEQLIRRDGPLPDGRVIGILKQVCDSLREAHAQGLIHRDIKPANIMLCDCGGAVDMVKVLDFGMVRDRFEQNLTESATLSGTPSYMAPECFSEEADLDPRIDVFSVGAVGFFLLTGQPLFDVENLHDLFQAHQRDISADALRRIQQATDFSSHHNDDLPRLIACCVANHPGQRPGSIEALLQGLKRCQPVDGWSGVEARSWWQAMATENMEATVEQPPAERAGSGLSLATTQSLPVQTYHNRDASSLIGC